MDHDIRGIAFRVGMRAPMADGRMANGAELARSAPWADVRALVGADVPGVGVIVDVRAPRINPLPVGARINLITASA
jgi:hypothetical protein